MILHTKYVFVYLFIGLLVYWFIVPPTSAQTIPQQAISISPIIDDITLTPGTETTHTITIVNNSDNPIGMTVEPGDLSALQSPDTIYSTPQSHSSPLPSWITIAPATLLLPAHTQREILVHIQTPSRATLGGYYATLLYTPFISQQHIPTQPIVLAHLVGLIFATVGVPDSSHLKNNTHILSFAPAHWIFETQKASVTFAVANDYVTHFSAKPFLTVTPLFGKPTTTLLEEKHVLPSTARVWNSTLRPTPYAPLYFAHLAVSLGNGEQISADTWFVVIPYHILVSIFIALCAVGMTLFRKRIRRAIGILLKG